jgi:hypothetical protein
MGLQYYTDRYQVRLVLDTICIYGQGNKASSD